MPPPGGLPRLLLACLVMLALQSRPSIGSSSDEPDFGDTPDGSGISGVPAPATPSLAPAAAPDDALYFTVVYPGGRDLVGTPSKLAQFRSSYLEGVSDFVIRSGLPLSTTFKIIMIQTTGDDVGVLTEVDTADPFEINILQSVLMREVQQVLAPLIRVGNGQFRLQDIQVGMGGSVYDQSPQALAARANETQEKLQAELERLAAEAEVARLAREIEMLKGASQGERAAPITDQQMDQTSPGGIKGREEMDAYLLFNAISSAVYKAIDETVSNAGKNPGASRQEMGEAGAALKDQEDLNSCLSNAIAAAVAFKAVDKALSARDAKSTSNSRPPAAGRVAGSRRHLQ